jgi:hypothetical protein
MEGAGRFGSHFVSGVRVVARCLCAGALADTVCLSHLRTNPFSNAPAYHRILYLIHNPFEWPCCAPFKRASALLVLGRAAAQQRAHSTRDPFLLTLRASSRCLLWREWVPPLPFTHGQPMP